MHHMEPEQAGFLLHLAIPSLKNEHRITKEVISAIPADKSDYKPNEVSKTAMELAYHIVAAELRFLDGVAAGEFDFSPRPKPESIKTPTDLAALYEEQFAASLKKVEAMTHEQSAKIIDFRCMFQLPAVMYLNFLMHHSVHHRGQLTMYLRPMGAKVPSIYGESHDATQARLAAAEKA